MNLQDIVDMKPAELNVLVHKIGNTPLVPIQIMIGQKICTISLKLESYNPTGSVKDRTGYALIRHVEEQHLITRGSVVIESTSGNLGVALALICKERGYQFIAVIDPKTTQENIAKMRMFGATVELVDIPDANGGYLLSRLEHVRERCRRNEHYVWPDQYSNYANPLIHYTTTGPEIFQQMQGKVDAVFVATSTGGTLAGIGHFFREASPRTRVIAIDAYGSVIFGTAPGPRKLTGIGSSRTSSFLQPSLYDAFIQVGDEDAFMYCRALATATGIKVGGSSGAALAACVQYLHTQPDIDNVVCICADSGENYMSSIFNDDWMKSEGLKVDVSELVQKILPATLPYKL